MTATTTQRLADNVVATLFPGYFALVMATGIIAIGAEQQELDWVAEPLFAIAIVAYVVLAGLLVARLVRYPRQLAADLTSHAKGFAFLTVVAATNVLGSAAIILHDWRGVAWVLWYASLALWAVLAYTPLIAVVLRSPKPGLGAGINGSWFLLTVSTESIAVLGALLLARQRQRRPGVRLPRRLHARARAVPHRDDDGVPAVDVSGARTDRGRPAGVDRRRCRGHHRPRRLQPAARP